MNQNLYTPEHAAMLQERAGQKYRPCNGEEGDFFAQRYCDHCAVKDCLILARAMAHDVEHPEYPGEWQYRADGQPTCMAFMAVESAGQSLFGEAQ